jgi:hypothetical protein
MVGVQFRSGADHNTNFQFLDQWCATTVSPTLPFRVKDLKSGKPYGVEKTVIIGECPHVAFDFIEDLISWIAGRCELSQT